MSIIWYGSYHLWKQSWLNFLLCEEFISGYGITLYVYMQVKKLDYALCQHKIGPFKCINSLA